MGNVNRCCPEKNLVWQMERHSGEKTSSDCLRNCKQLPVCTKLSLRGRPAGRSIHAPAAPPFPGTDKDTEATEKVPGQLDQEKGNGGDSQEVAELRSALVWDRVQPEPHRGHCL